MTKRRTTLVAVTRFELDGAVDGKQLTAAILRCVNSKFFAFRGQCTVMAVAPTIEYRVPVELPGPTLATLLEASEPWSGPTIAEAPRALEPSGGRTSS